MDMEVVEDIADIDVEVAIDGAIEDITVPVLDDDASMADMEAWEVLIGITTAVEVPVYIVAPGAEEGDEGEAIMTSAGMLMPTVAQRVCANLRAPFLKNSC